MGNCVDCLHFDRSYEQKRLLQPTLYGCTYLNQYVTESGSCSAFQPKPEYHSGSSCFLTSACVKYLGKPDDCEELTLLRAFRDGYIKSLCGGGKIIEEYYHIAPKIVEKIDLSGKSDEYYKYIYGMIDKCVSLIKSQENEKALELYKDMVLKLSEEFNINKS